MHGQPIIKKLTKAEGKSSFRRPRYEWESIKIIFKETKAQVWLAKDREESRGPVNKATLQ